MTGKKIEKEQICYFVQNILIFSLNKEGNPERKAPDKFILWPGKKIVFPENNTFISIHWRLQKLIHSSDRKNIVVKLLPN